MMIDPKQFFMYFFIWKKVAHTFLALLFHVVPDINNQVIHLDPFRPDWVLCSEIDFWVLSYNSRLPNNVLWFLRQ